MRIRAKLFLTLLGMSLVVALVGSLAVDRQRAIAMIGVTKEAEDLARLLGFLLMSDANKLPAPAIQEIVEKLHQSQGRDVTLTDTNQLILADAIPSEIGTIYTTDLGDEVGATIRDRQVRVFVETSEAFPTGIKQMVVPVEGDHGQVIGAVILEYTPLYNELMELTRETILQTALAGLGGVAIASLLALYMGRSISGPLQQLTNAATAFAAGRSDFLMPPPRKDEIGELAAAFEDMVKKRQSTNEKLQSLNDQLELRVVARTTELTMSNEALLAENKERKSAEETLRDSEEKFHQLADSVTEVFWMASPDMQQVHYVNPAYELIWDRSVASLYDHPQEWAEAILPEDRERVHAALSRLSVAEPSVSMEYRIARSDGAVRWISSRGFQVRDIAGKVIRITGIASDITDRKQIEARLFQSQKMETVGKLAGGIAHEFNSILTAIIGQSEILLGDLPTGNPLSKNATEIRKAADRAAILTRQLLAYGRKQILRPEILSLNSILAGLEIPMHGLVGRRTDLRITPAAGLKPTKADAQQIEEVIICLVINAAEAMPDGGKLTLETANVTLDQEYVSRFPELNAGEYVMLAITDTGSGMSGEVKAHAFEPFFTTKGAGEGAGLGLSTCYGIIKQSGGHISVYSEPGRGTTFKLYLPEVESQTAIAIKRPEQPALPGGAETVLLVEDDPSLREAAATLLIRLGYTVVTAANGVEALGLLHQRGVGRFDLLFTDVVMPQMSGRELAEKMRALYPHIRTLYTSAYTENAISHQGVLDNGVSLLQKPFTPSALAHRLREVLDQPETSRENGVLANIAAGVP